MDRRWKLLALAAIAACDAPRPTPASPVSPRQAAPAVSTAASAVEPTPTAPVDAAPKRYTLPELMKAPVRPLSIDIGATKDEPAYSFTVELPEHYARLVGEPDRYYSSQIFGATDSFQPSFTFKRARGAEPVDDPYKDAVITRGTRSGAPWQVQIKSGNFASLTSASIVVTTPRGKIECKGYVDTTDTTPIHDWMLERCLTIRVR